MKRFVIFALLISSATAFSQGIVTGTVIDSELNAPLPGATVILSGTKTGVTTNFEGNFSLTVPENTGTIEINFLGYLARKISFSISNGSADLGIILMNSDEAALSEVVVIGSGVIDLEEDRQTPIAVSTIRKREIQQKAVGNVEFPEVMKNVPSVYVSSQTGFGDSQMFLRGFEQSNTAFLLNGQPINGMEDGLMYWSNWSGMTDIANAVQVQRGLGSSKLAISSVGGTVNIISKTTEKKEGGFARFLAGNDSFFKTTVSYDSGLSDNGWGFSIMLDHWQGHRKFAEGTFGEGQNYFFSVGKLIGNHNFNFLIFGAPQIHGQRWSQSREILDVFPKYNQHWGFDEGELVSERTNFYHKPVANLNWDWKINEASSLSTVLYGSLGRGGGTGPLGSGRIRTDDYRIQGVSIPGQIDYAAIRRQNEQIGLGNDEGNPMGSGYIRRASMNNHQWFGVVSNFEHDFNENWNFNIGSDVRYYTGDHFRQVVDFYGLQGWANERPDDEVVVSYFSINPWKTLFNYADESERIDYDYSETITYQGGFGQLEYASELFSAFVQGALSHQSYQRKNRFGTDLEGEAFTIISEVANKIGYNLKGGAAYRLNEQSTLFANGGFYSRQPYLDNIFSGITELADPEVDNEEILGLEAGYTYETRNFRANINLYRTEWANRYISTGNTILVADTGSEVDINREQTDVTQLHQGIEVDVSYRPNGKLKIGGYISLGNWEFAGTTPYRSRDFRNNQYFENSEVGDYTDINGNALPTNFFSGNVDLDGVALGNAPQFSMGSNFLYQFTPNLNVGLDWNYYDRLFAFVDVADVVTRGSSYQTDELNSYAIFDLTAGYDFDLFSKKFQIKANIYNLFDHQFVNQTDNFGVFYGNGRTWNASLTYQF